jgi:ribosome biogenesis GTPase
LIRVKKWFEEKEQRLARKERKRDRPSKGQRSVSDRGLTHDDTQYPDGGELHPRTRSAGPVDRSQEQISTVEAYATVVEVRASEALVSHDGRLIRARFAPALFSDTSSRSPVAVGDMVQITFQGAEQARVEKVMPRRSSLARGTGDATRRETRLDTHLLAANVDQVVVVSSAAEPPFRPRLIDRFLVAASRDGLPAVLCVNKVDLGLSTASETHLRGYADLGITVLLTSAVSGKGIDSLMEVVRGKKSLLTGHSGVGKSSLLNAMEPGLARRVGSVTQASAGQGKGTHTTSASRLVPLSMPDTFIVDTPGIRSFSIIGLPPKDLAAHFPEIARLAPSCEFRNCLHDGERGCALSSATQESSFLEARLTSYRLLLAELR